MKKRSKLTKEEWVQVYAEYIAGATVIALAARYGMSPGTIYNHVSRNRVDRTGGGVKRGSEAAASNNPIETNWSLGPTVDDAKRVSCLRCRRSFIGARHIRICLTCKNALRECNALDLIPQLEGRQRR